MPSIPSREPYHYVCSSRPKVGFVSYQRQSLILPLTRFRMQELIFTTIPLGILHSIPVLHRNPYCPYHRAFSIMPDALKEHRAMPLSSPHGAYRASLAPRPIWHIRGIFICTVLGGRCQPLWSAGPDDGQALKLVSRQPQLFRPDCLRRIHGHLSASQGTQQVSISPYAPPRQCEHRDSNSD